MSRNSDALQPRTSPTFDVVVATALSVEFTAMHDALELGESVPQTLPEGTMVHYGSVWSALTRQHYSVLLTSVGGAGSVRAAAVIRRVIDEHQPKAVFFVGIAGGARGVAARRRGSPTAVRVAYSSGTTPPSIGPSSSTPSAPRAPTTPCTMHRSISRPPSGVLTAALGARTRTLSPSSTSWASPSGAKPANTRITRSTTRGDRRALVYLHDHLETTGRH